MLGLVLLRRESLGGGDIKLLAVMGVFLGWRGALWSLYLGAFIGAVVGLTLILLRRRDRRAPIPFGPFLSAGALIWMVWRGTGG